MENNDKLSEILSEDHVPKIDINARKRAVNLAVSEFKSAQTEINKEKNQKNFQGFGFISRLIGINTRKGEKTMEQRNKKRFMYGGAATAMAVVLVGGLSLTQLNDTVIRHEQNVSITSTPKPEQEVAPAYIAALEEQNEDDANVKFDDGLADWKRSDSDVDKAASPNLGAGIAEKERQESSVDSAPVPMAESVDGTVGLKKLAPPKNKDAIAPLDNWTRSRANSQAPKLQEERVASPSVARKLKAEKKAIGKTLQYNAPNSVVAEDMVAPYPTPMPPIVQEQNRDKFEQFTVNPFKQVSSEPVSTFSSDVDTASYSFIRKTLNSGRLPNPDAVRVEEMINYFDYNYPVPESRTEPFKPTVVVTDSPWAEGRKLMHIGIKGYQLAKTELRSNIVFLLDVSGSMNARDKLPLVKSSMKMLLDSLHGDDTVSIVIYAGSTGVVLEPTKVSNRSTILNAMNNLRAGGGTAGAAGIRLAYDMAERNFDKHAVNRVIMATDGDFNVGITNRDDLKKYVEKKRDKGIFLSVLGFGQGNYNDHMMQSLAQNGNGIAAYIDNLNEARNVLVQEATSSLFPIAKDVKFQVEFNSDAVAEYRLIGYETRSLKREDFNNDKIDAGDMGAGHTVTAIYEFVPVGSKSVSVDPLRYGKVKPMVKKGKDVNEYAFLKIRYKLPMESKSKLISMPVSKNIEYRRDMSDVRFATAVAAFGQILKGEQYIGDFSYDDVISLAQSGKGSDPYGYRAEFINMVRLAKTLSR